ncbi:MAG: hypothetical protein MUC68_11895, partial [Burkholderiaceae bacterium]|nr:hypothetical protein [Burkholderiaceae bacterium]
MRAGGIQLRGEWGGRGADADTHAAGTMRCSGTASLGIHGARRAAAAAAGVTAACLSFFFASPGDDFGSRPGGARRRSAGVACCGARPRAIAARAASTPMIG